MDRVVVRAAWHRLVAEAVDALTQLLVAYGTLLSAHRNLQAARTPLWAGIGREGHPARALPQRASGGTSPAV